MANVKFKTEHITDNLGTVITSSLYFELLGDEQIRMQKIVVII